MDRSQPWFRGLTGAQWLILFVAWLGWVFDVMDAALFNLAKGPMLTQMLGGPAAYRQGGANVEGWIQAIFLTGWAIGGLVFGILADRWGRTRVLLLTILLYCTFTGLTAICRDPAQVAFVRFLTALGIGGEWAAGAALVAEALPDRARAGAASFIQSAAAFGPILAALINLMLKGHDWRWLFVAGIAPALLCLAIRFKVKEPEVTHRAVPIAKSPIREVFSDPHWRRNAIVAMAIGVVGIAGANTATYWAPNLVEAASTGLAKAEIDARKSAVTIISHGGTLLGICVVPWLCNVFGRKRTIFGFFLAAPLALLCGLANPTYGKLLFAMPLVNFFVIGVTAAFVLYFPELFPTRMRATGAGLAYNVGRVFTIPIPYVTALAITHFGGALTGGVATGVLLTGSIYLLGLVAIPFAPETRGQPLPD